MKAKEEGFDQVLWTDGDGHEFIEESGTMNIMFMIDDVLVTPSLTDTILDGVTRDSLVQIARDMGVKVQERKISYLELKAALQDGKKLEAFGYGTAAITAPIAVIQIDGSDNDVPPY
jgi:branched-chain amino acid aminotransferase